MRHCAGLYSRDFGHCLCRHHRDTRRRHVAMQIEVDYEKKVAVGCDVKCRRKVTESGLPNQRVIFSRILPDRSKWPAVCDRDVIKLSIRRDDDAVWTIN